MAGGTMQKDGSRCVFTCTSSAGASNRNAIPNDVFRITKNKLVVAYPTAGRLGLPHLEALVKN
jgi:hypothetical protein